MDISEEKNEVLDLMAKGEALVDALPEGPKKRILQLVNREMRDVNQRLFAISDAGEEGNEEELTSIFKEVMAYEAIKDIAINLN